MSPEESNPDNDLDIARLGEDDYAGSMATLLQGKTATVRRTLSYLPHASAHLIAGVENIHLTIFPFDREGLNELETMVEYRISEDGQGRQDLGAALARGFIKRITSRQPPTAESWKQQQPQDVELPNMEGGRKW